MVAPRRVPKTRARYPSGPDLSFEPQRAAACSIGWGKLQNRA